MRLKSGGPDMTVLGPHVQNETEVSTRWVSCSYFAHDEVRVVGFPPEAISRSKDDEEEFVERAHRIREECLAFDAEIRKIIGAPAIKFVTMMETVDWLRETVTSLATQLGYSQPSFMSLGALRATGWLINRAPAPPAELPLASCTEDQCATLHPNADGSETRCPYRKQPHSGYCEGCDTPF